MKIRAFLTIIAILGIVGGVFSITTMNTQADGTALAEITSYTINDAAGRIITDADPLIAGSTYTVDFEINIGIASSDKLILTTDLEKAKDVYWELLNSDEYPIEPWQPADKSIEFDAVKGVAQLKLTGTVPEDYTSEEPLPNGDVLHFEKDITVIKLSLSSGDLLGQRSKKVIDQTISGYQSSLQEKQDWLEDADAESHYINLVEEVVNEAQVLADKGYAERATSLLNTIPNPPEWSPKPIPQSIPSVLPYIIVIIIVVLIAIALVALFFKSRSSADFMRRQVQEETDNLDEIAHEAGRVNRSLSDKIDKVRENLEGISRR
jgi:hypothetical protein